MRQFIFATAVLMSTIVGVGMFTLPYTGAQSGFLIAAVFLIVLTAIMMLLHLLYGEIVVRTKEKYRLVGYGNYYLGKKVKLVLAVTAFVGFYGSLLVYIIVGGDFLNGVLSSVINIPSIAFNLIFFIIGAIAVYFGIKLIAELDFLMSVFLIIIVCLILYFGFSQIDINNLKAINFKNLAYPYGAVLYSLAGIAAIPEIRELASKSNKAYKSAIILGTIIPGILYFIFIYVVIGLTGANTSQEAINGLISVLGRKIVFWGSLFGFLACITSFFIIGLSLKKTFWYDFEINKNLSWFLVCLIPLLLFILGVKDFIPIIIILGALAALIQGSAIVLIHKKVKKFGQQVSNYNLRIPNWLRYIIVLVFILGFIYTLITII